MKNTKQVRQYLSPIIGTGQGADDRRPLTSAMLKRASWIMHELGDGQNCIVTILGSSDEHKQLRSSFDVVEIEDKTKIEDLPINEALKKAAKKKFAVAQKCNFHGGKQKVSFTETKRNE